MSKRVRVYKPKLSHSIVDKKRVTTIVDRKDRFIEERAVMDRTLEQYEVNELNTIIQSGLWMEEVVKEDVQSDDIDDDAAPKKKIRRTKEQIEADNQK